MIDYYHILGVSPTATQHDIQSAFRKLAKQTHPDLNQNNPKKVSLFQQIKEAYDILSHPDKRKRYDRQRQLEKQRKIPASKPSQTTSSPSTLHSESRRERPSLTPAEFRFLSKRNGTRRWIRYHLFSFLIILGFHFILHAVYLPFLYRAYPLISQFLLWAMIYKILWIIILSIRFFWLKVQFRHHKI